MYPFFGCWVRFVNEMKVVFVMLVVTRAYDNVALNKPAYQLYPYGEGDMYDATNAVDGFKTDLDIDGGQCVVSDTERSIATWRVDLGSIHYIDHIFLYFMTGNQPWGDSNNKISSFLGFSLYVSNTTSRLQGRLCFKDTSFTEETIPDIFNTSCRMFGRHVIYYNERLPEVDYPSDYNEDAKNDLCEVEVYGCPTENSNCDVWDPLTCACLVCKGRNIETVCDDGYFGYGCHQECSIFCNKGGDCHHLSGICKYGCSNGGEGPFCSVDTEDNAIVSVYGFIGVSCLLIIIIGALIIYIMLTRISMKRSNARRQKSIEMKKTHHSTNEASHERVVSGDYLGIEEFNQNEPCYIEINTGGFV